MSDTAPRGSGTAEGPQGRRAIEALLVEHGHRPNRRYGQNFLTDPNIVRRIVEIAEVGGRNVVEVGAGTGTLTRALAADAHLVVAYEIDAGLIPILTEALADVRNVDVRLEDVTRIDLARLHGTGTWILVGNLPYNVGTGIVLDTLTGVPTVDRLVVTVQFEVAERLVAGPGTKVYGIPSVITALHGTASIAMSVPPQVFEPRPRVESAVVLIDRIEPPPRAERAIAIATAAFGQRRKMLRKSLAEVLEDPVATLEAAGIDPRDRPEDLDPHAYVAIAQIEATQMEATQIEATGPESAPGDDGAGR